MKEFQGQEYLKTFGGKDKEKLEKALRYALETRRLEIELYWRRATYFWAFIAATLAAYGFILKSSTDLSPIINITLSGLICCLGMVLSWAWFFVNKGSKFWQENWENHVAILEDQIIGPLYKTLVIRNELYAKLKNSETSKSNCFSSLRACLIKPAAYSVSKINQIISFYVFEFWIILSIVIILYNTVPCLVYLLLVMQIIISIICMVIIKKWATTDLNKIMMEPDQQLNCVQFLIKLNNYSGDE